MSETLLIDVTNIFQTNELLLLKNRVKPVPESEAKIGLLLLASEAALDHLNSLPLGEARVNQMNSAGFVSQIKGYAYVAFDVNTETCRLLRGSRFPVKTVVDGLLSWLPATTTLWVSVKPKVSQAEKYVKVGFGNPYICKVGDSEYICLSKKNDNVPTDNSTTLDSVRYVLSQEGNTTCVVTLRFSEKAVNYLEKLPVTGTSLNGDGRMSQKEVAGTLVSQGTTKELVHILGVDHDSLILGEEQGVPVVEGLYNFHSHPKEAYEANHVHLGWPSAQDYIGFFAAFLEDGTICHFVVAREGIYLMSFPPRQLEGELPEESVVSFIKSNLNFCPQPGQTVDWYVKKVNEVKYNGSPLFRLRYVPWSNATAPFTVHFRRKGANCFTNDETLESYLKNGCHVKMKTGVTKESSMSIVPKIDILINGHGHPLPTSLSLPVNSQLVFAADEGASCYIPSDIDSLRLVFNKMKGYPRELSDSDYQVWFDPQENPHFGVFQVENNGDFYGIDLGDNTMSLSQITREIYEDAPDALLTFYCLFCRGGREDFSERSHPAEHFMPNPEIFLGDNLTWGESDFMDMEDL